MGLARRLRRPVSISLPSLLRLVAALLLGAALPAAAQAPAPAVPGGGLLTPPSLPSLSGGGGAQSEILQRILDAAGSPRGGVPLPVPSPLPPPPAALPAPPPPAPLAEEPLSHTEGFFAARMDLPVPLRQFGYDTFRVAPGAVPPPLGLLPDDYILGRDDELVLALRGRARQTIAVRVQRDGLLLVPDLPPIQAAGRTLADLRADVAGRVARDLPGTEAFLSVGQLRQIPVFVAGEVTRPGMQALTALSSVLDALAAAGGVRRTGSLRAIRVEGPQGGPPRIIDLYAVIAGAPGSPVLLLREGDRVLVPPLGGVVAIGGEVTRPAIYELPAGAGAAPLATMLRLAGDPLRPGGNRFLVQGTDAQGRRSFAEISARDAIRRGDALLVQPANDVVANRLRLAGHVAAPVTRATGGRAGTGLRALLGDPRLVRPDPYLRMGVVLRADPASRARRFLPFDLARVLTGAADMPLAEDDEVVVLGMPDIAFLASPPVQRALRGEAPSDAHCPALLQLAIAARAAPARFAHARSAGFPELGAPPCPKVFQDYPQLLPFLLDTAVLLTGEVRQPGLYPVLDDTGLDLLLETAGGATDGADLSAVELTREPAETAGAIPLTRLALDLRSRNFAAVRLSPRDVLRMPRGFGDREPGPVTLLGEVLRPGTYDIRRGERLSELLARAGGLTPQAYSYGTVFTRESVRLRQQEGFDRTARELEQSLIQVAAGQAVAGSRGSPADLGSAITAGRQLAGALREARAAGRMVVEANPVVLAARPELDVLLEPGDLIAVPKRPNEVTVVGAVLNPGSLQFTTGWRASDYVEGAGGTQRFADPPRAFVVLPNGQSAPAGLSAWQMGGPPVPPGSLVVVPQDPSPYEGWGFLRDVTHVLSQITLSAAALAVVAREGSR
jgi:protein involved in polysaccharide export with SLBB domain